VGIAIITASMVVVLSAFNGIEKMIERLYSDFDAPITIRSHQTKTFFEDQVEFDKLTDIKGIKQYALACEDIVVLKHEDKWSNATLIGVTPSFLSIANMDSHIVDGFAALYENDREVGIIGATLLDNLGGYIPQTYGKEMVMIYAPKRNLKMQMSKNPFHTQLVPISARMNFNKEVNASTLIVPIELARNVLGYSDNELNAIYVDIDDLNDKKHIKNEIQQLLGDEFKVKTNDEKNELIFKTAQTERLLVIVILCFIFLLAAFNLVASLNMLMIEKKNDMQILKSMGAEQHLLVRIFFYEGLLIAGQGIACGLLLGYLICGLQLQFGLLEMPNTHGEIFPIALNISDFLTIVILLGTLSVVASYIPVKLFLNTTQTD